MGMSRTSTNPARTTRIDRFVPEGIRVSIQEALYDMLKNRQSVWRG